MATVLMLQQGPGKPLRTSTVDPGTYYINYYYLRSQNPQEHFEITEGTLKSHQGSRSNKIHQSEQRLNGTIYRNTVK